jgi:hypothetical protein
MEFCYRPNGPEKSTQVEVEHYTRAMCCKHFSLTENTPLHQEPFYMAFGPLAINTPAARAILHGTYTIPKGMDNYTREFLNTLQAHAPCNPHLRISCEITKEDFQQFWRKQKERMSSSISGLHYGHYKAAANDATLSEIHALFTELAVTGGSPFSRWETGLSCMLEKVAGVIKVN